MFNRKKKENKYHMPTYMRVGVTLFLVWMAFVGYRNEQEAKEGNPNATSIKRYEVIQNFADVDGWLKAANPDYNQDIQFEEIKVGTKDIAACGQTVTMKATQIPEEGQAADPALSTAEPLTFTIGDGKALKAWDLGVRGMREGGIRRLWAGARLVNPQEENYEASSFAFTLELQTITPNLPENSPLFVFESDRGDKRMRGVPVDCGQEARVSLKLLNTENKVLYERTENDPLTVMIGQSTYGHGLDRGLTGMFPLESRRITVPPAYQLKNSEIPYPLNEIAIVEAKRLPYNVVPKEEKAAPDDESAPTPTEPENKEPENEPDSQPSERDQTLPDHGGDRQGGGT